MYFLRDHRSFPVRTDAGYIAFWVPPDCLHLAIQYQLSSGLDWSHGSLLLGDHTLLVASQVRCHPNGIRQRIYRPRKVSRTLPYSTACALCEC